MQEGPFNVLRHTDWERAPRDPVSMIAIGNAVFSTVGASTSHLALLYATGLGVQLGISAVTSWALSALAPKPNINSVAGAGLKTNLKDAAADLEIVYGTIRKGGVITYLEGEPSDTNGYLSMIITLAGHEVEEIGQIYINDEPVTLNGSGFVTNDRWTVSTDGTPNKIQIFKYTGSQTTASAPLLSHSELLDSKFIGRQTAYLYIRMKYDTSVFSGGIPTFTAVVKGKKVYDPRLNSGAGGTAWSANAALCIRDYLTSYYGLEESSSAIDDVVFSSAANVCDEAIPLGTGYLEGATEKRYEINGVLSANDTPENNLQKMMTACAGTLYWGGGLWKLKPGYYVTPTVSLGLEDVRGPLNVETRVSRRDNFNIVRGTFVNYAPNAEDPAPWRTEDYPEIKSATFITEDNGIENPLDLTLPLTTSLAMAQRLAKLTLFRGREQITMNVDFSIAAFEVQVGEIIQFTNSRYGWSAKEFEVTSWKFYIADGGELKVNLGLRETSEAAFDWDAEEVDIISNNTNLPSYNAGMTITNFNAANSGGRLRKDGTWLPRVELSWDAVGSTFVYEYDIRYKVNGEADTEYTYLITKQSSAIIRGLSDEQTYYFEVRARNYAGYSGAWVSDTLVVLEDTTAPGIPTSLTATGTFRGIRVSWVNPADEDLRHVEVWNDGSKIAEVAGTEFLHVLSTGDSENYTVRSVDFSGNVSSFTSASNTATAGSIEAGEIAPGSVGAAELAETNTGGNIVPDGIMREQNTALWGDNSNCTFSYSSTGLSGAGSLALAISSLGSNASIRTQIFTSVTGGALYSVYAIAKASGSTNGGAIDILEYAADQSTIVTTSNNVLTLDGLTPTDWDTIKGQWTPNIATRFVRFRIRADTTFNESILYIDTLSCSLGLEQFNIVDGEITNDKLAPDGLDATKFTIGEMSGDRISSLAAAKVVGALATGNIPNLPASIITSGQFGADRIAANAITQSKILARSVGAAQLAETNTGGNIVPDGVMREQVFPGVWSFLSGGTAGYSSTIGLSGEGSLYLSPTGTGQASVNTAIFSSVEEGRSYSLTAVWQSSPAASPAGAYIQVLYYTGAQVYISFENVINNISLGSTWTTTEATFTPPANTRFVLFRFLLNNNYGSTRTVYLDSLYCEKVLAENNIVDLSAGKITSGSFADARIPNLDAGKITSGAFADARIPALAASKITSGTFSNAFIASGLDAGKLTVGTIPEARITSLAAAKVVGALATGNIPNLDAGKITSGAFADARIPALAASKITSGTFANSFIASGLDASKLTIGTLPIDRIATKAITKEKIANNAIGVAQLSETNTGGNLVPDPFMREMNTDILVETNTSAIGYDAGNGISGAGSLYFTVASEASTAWVGYDTEVWASIEEGESYSLAFRHKCPSTVTALYFSVYWYSDNTFSSYISNGSTGPVTSNSNWQVDRNVVTAPVGARYAFFLYTSYATGHSGGETIYIDSASAVKIPNSDDLPDLAASKITSGTFSNSFIASGLDAGKLTIGTIPEARITSLAGSKISSAIAEANIPALNAANKLYGTLDVDRIGTGSLPGSKVQGLSLTAAQLASSAVEKAKLDAKAVGAAAVIEHNLGGNVIPDPLFSEKDDTWFDTSASSLSWASAANSLSGQTAAVLQQTSAGGATNYCYGTYYGAIEGGEEYDCKFVYKISESNASQTVRLRLAWSTSDSGSGYISSSDLSVSNPSGGYQVARGTVTAPSDARFVRAELITTGVNVGQYVVFDSVEVTTERAAFYFKRGKSLDPVSKVLGIPTGGIVESGVNANGAYEKLMNGRMMCWERQAITANNGNDWNQAAGALWQSTSLFSWTYPVAFETSTELSLFSTAERPSTQNIGATLYDYSSTVSNWRGWTTAALNDTDTKYVHYKAIGRWDNIQ